VSSPPLIATAPAPRCSTPTTSPRSRGSNASFGSPEKLISSIPLSRRSSESMPFSFQPSSIVSRSKMNEIDVGVTASSPASFLLSLDRTRSGGGVDVTMLQPRSSSGYASDTSVASRGGGSSMGVSGGQYSLFNSSRPQHMDSFAARQAAQIAPLPQLSLSQSQTPAAGVPTRYVVVGGTSYPSHDPAAASNPAQRASALQAMGSGSLAPSQRPTSPGFLGAPAHALASMQMQMQMQGRTGLPPFGVSAAARTSPTSVSLARVSPLQGLSVLPEPVSPPVAAWNEWRSSSALRGSVASSSAPSPSTRPPSRPGAPVPMSPSQSSPVQAAAVSTSVDAEDLVSSNARASEARTLPASAPSPVVFDDKTGPIANLVSTLNHRRYQASVSSVKTNGSDDVSRDFYQLSLSASSSNTNNASQQHAVGAAEAAPVQVPSSKEKGPRSTRLSTQTTISGFSASSRSGLKNSLGESSSSSGSRGSNTHPGSENRGLDSLSVSTGGSGSAFSMVASSRTRTHGHTLTEQEDLSTKFITQYIRVKGRLD
jgi:hypothetical protein